MLERVWIKGNPFTLLVGMQTSTATGENSVEIPSDSSVQSLSCVQLCDPMDCSTPGLPVPHHSLEFVQVHIHCISDAVQPSHPLSSHSPPTFNLSQHQGLFQWVSSSHQLAKVLEFQLQCQSFQWIFRTGWTGWISLHSKGLSRVFSSTTVWKHWYICRMLGT